jgi:hypothetical protein
MNYTGTPPPIDVCSNITGVQETLPAGMSYYQTTECHVPCEHDAQYPTGDPLCVAPPPPPAPPGDAQSERAEMLGISLGFVVGFYIVHRLGVWRG